ncbi:MAG: glycosyltransferase family 4 protein [Rhodospirillales bacterium]
MIAIPAQPIDRPATAVAPLRVLCLDIEGGYGGSSRSLYNTIRYLPAGDVSCEVWHRKAGPIAAMYEALGIPARQEPSIRSVAAFHRQLPSINDTVQEFARLTFRDRSFRERIKREITERFDLVHFNHEGLWLLALMLRRMGVDLPFTMHIRRVAPASAIARFQASMINRAIDRLIFISEEERVHIRNNGCAVDGIVVHNAVEPFDPDTPPHPAIPQDDRFKVASLANYSWARGVDQIVDVAAALKRRGRNDILFVLAGNLEVPGSLPGPLGRIGRNGGGVRQWAIERGVEDMCLFLGHVSLPAQVIAGSQALIKTARRDFPWGRDILEGLGAGRPVLTTGTVETFVQTDVTGYLMHEFNPETAAAVLCDWAGNRDKCERLGSAGRERVMALCSGPGRSADVLGFWRSAVSLRQRGIEA